MELPYDLTEDRLVLDSSSIRRLEAGQLEPADILGELYDRVTPDEIDRGLWSTGALIAKGLEQWIGDGHMNRHPTDFVMMALDTAMVWERG
jgi:hypothetical protein